MIARSLPLLARFLTETRGATAIEYSLICGLIFLAIVVPLQTLLGPTLVSLFSGIAENLK